ncbi:MAG: hypothetical protein R2824_33650 [Saprospiraceae bacterium]
MAGRTFLPSTDGEGGQPDSLLYLNDGAGGFWRLPIWILYTALSPSDGAAFADIDIIDGDLDGVVSSWYGWEDRLYRNDDGVLDYRENAGIVPGSYAETASFGDYDNDAGSIFISQIVG